MNKTCRDTNVTEKCNGDKDEKQTWSITVIDGLSRNGRQSGALQLIRMETRECRMLEGLVLLY